MNLTLVCLLLNTVHPVLEQTLCTVLSDTEMTCPTPRLLFEAQPPCLVDNPPSRRRRSSDDVSSDNVINRVRRQLINNQFSRQFYIGLILDGVPTYRNVTEALG